MVKKNVNNFINNRPYMAVISGWAMTGNSQVYNGQYLKALLFYCPNLISNQLGHLNESLLHAFTGEIAKSQTVLNYQWILYYPAWFVIAQWDGYKVAYEKQYLCSPPISHKLPFELSGFFSVLGVIAGSKLFPGSLFLGIGGYFLGGVIGILIIKLSKNHD